MESTKKSKEKSSEEINEIELQEGNSAVLKEISCITTILWLNNLPKLLKHRYRENKAAQLPQPA